MHSRRIRNTESLVYRADWDFVTGEDDADELVCVPLTRAQIRTIGAITAYQRYPNRWYGQVPGKPVLDEFIDQLEAALTGECMSVTDIRINNCMLEVQQTGSEDWIVVGDLSACVVSQGVQNLQDDNCQLQADYGAGWVDVPGANYMPTDARCEFTDTVKISRPINGIVENLQLNNDDTFDALNGTFISFLANWFGNFRRKQARITGAWDNATTEEGRLNLDVGRADNWTNILRLNAAVDTVSLTMRNLLGHSRGLAVNGAEFGANPTQVGIAIQNSETFRFQAFLNGQLSISPRPPTGTTIADGLQVHAYNPTITPAGGFGTNIRIRAQTTTASAEDVSRIEALWGNATHAAREALLRFRVYNYAGGVLPLQLGNQDSAEAIGFLGSSPITRRTHTALTEIDAINEINATLEAFGLITDDTDVVADSGNGGGEPMATEEYVTEIYRNLALSDFDMTPSGGGGFGQWSSTIGWTPGSTGFKVNRNYDAGQQIIAVRVKFETNFTTGQTVGLGFDMTGLTRLLHEEFIGTGQLFHVWNYRVLWQNTSVTAVGLHVREISETDYDPSQHGSITWTNLDIAVRGFANQEADGPNYFDPLSEPTRFLKYANLIDNFDGDDWQWELN